MSTPLTVQCQVHLRRRGKGRQELVTGAGPEALPREPGQVPRVARLAALAIAGTFDPSATAEILLAALKGVTSGKPLLLADGGVENYNGAVDELDWLGSAEPSPGPNRNRLLQFAHRIVVASPQAPVAVPEHARHGPDRRQVGRVLCAGAQYASSAFGLPGANARRDVLQYREPGARRFGSCSPKGPPGTSAGQSATHLQRLRTVDPEWQLNIAKGRIDRGPIVRHGRHDVPNGAKATKSRIRQQCDLPSGRRQGSACVKWRELAHKTAECHDRLHGSLLYAPRRRRRRVRPRYRTGRRVRHGRDLRRGWKDADDYRAWRGCEQGVASKLSGSEEEIFRWMEKHRRGRRARPRYSRTRRQIHHLGRLYSFTPVA